AMPAIALLAASLVVGIPGTISRTGVALGVCACCLLQTAALLTPMSFPGLADRVLVGTPLGTAVLALSSQQLGADRLPESRDYATPILHYLESLTGARGDPTPRAVCTLQPDRL